MKSQSLMLFSSLLLLAACGEAVKNRNTVRIDLPLPAKLDVSHFDYVYFPGFIVETKPPNFDVDREAILFFQREFQRKEAMAVLKEAPIDLSGRDPREFFARQQPFFKTLNFDKAERTLAVTGVIGFESIDRSGFHEVSNTDSYGRPYYRTVYTEKTGFNLNIRIYVYELAQGNLLYREVLRDGVEFEGKDLDEKLVYYDLLQRMSDRITGLFSSTIVKAERNLL